MAVKVINRIVVWSNDELASQHDDPPSRRAARLVVWPTHALAKANSIVSTVVERITEDSETRILENSDTRVLE